MSVKLDTQHLTKFLKSDEYEALAPQVKLAHEMLHSGTGLGLSLIHIFSYFRFDSMFWKDESLLKR